MCHLSDKYCHYKCSRVTDQAAHWSDELITGLLLADVSPSVRRCVITSGHRSHEQTHYNVSLDHHIEILIPWEPTASVWFLSLCGYLDTFSFNFNFFQIRARLKSSGENPYLLKNPSKNVSTHESTFWRKVKVMLQNVNFITKGISTYVPIISNFPNIEWPRISISYNPGERWCVMCDGGWGGFGTWPGSCHKHSLSFIARYQIISGIMWSDLESVCVNHSDQMCELHLICMPTLSIKFTHWLLSSYLFNINAK